MRLYVINLDRSTDRWISVSQSAREAGLDVARVEALDGLASPRDEWQEVDERRFGLFHGRSILPGEYGCYRSHLMALDTFLASKETAGIVCEDDVLLAPRLPDVVTEVLRERPDMHMLKLANHRVKGFRRHGGTGAAEFGRCVHGPQGSAACYAVTREGAKLLRDRLATMWLPYDVAFERGWAMGARIYTLRSAGVRFNRAFSASTIIDRRSGDRGYRTSKAPLFFRAPTALFRGADYLSRLRYAFA